MCGRAGIRDIDISRLSAKQQDYGTRKAHPYHQQAQRPCSVDTDKSHIVCSRFTVSTSRVEVLRKLKNQALIMHQTCSEHLLYA